LKYEKVNFWFIKHNFLLTFSAHAATIAVNTLTDENNTNNTACSLREAINSANGNNTTNSLGCVAVSGTDDIVFSVSRTINLTAVLPDINSSMNIGNNTTTAPNLTVNRSSGGAYRIFLVNAGNTVSMSGIVITNGSGTDFGGGIRNNGTLTLTNCIISNNNTSNEGTGVFNQGSLTVLNSSFLNNTSNSYGGGLSHRFGSFLSISNSTFSGNSATTGGGAIDLSNPNVTISNTTFNNNSAGFGGAITMAANANLINCTFTNNTAGSFSSGAVLVYNNITAGITNSTFAQNSVGGIGVESGSLLTITNTIVAGNTTADLTTPRDITGNVVAGSLNNLIGTGGAGGLTNGVNGNQTNVSFANVRLLPLGNYGGSVQTMPIRTNSPARMQERTRARRRPTRAGFRVRNK
jgi:CSLREA domain-containing protein